LPPMLEGMETEVGEVSGLWMAENAENAAHE